MRNEIKSINEKLGSKRLLHHRLTTSSDLEAIVEEGLPKESLQRIASSIAIYESIPTSDIVYKVVPQATYKRRQKLSTEASEKTVRIARIVELAEFVFDDKDKALGFLTKKHKSLNDRKPYIAVLNEIGARRVEDILWKIFYGIPS